MAWHLGSGVWRVRESSRCTTSPVSPVQAASCQSGRLISSSQRWYTSCSCPWSPCARHHLLLASPLLGPELVGWREPKTRVLVRRAGGGTTSRTSGCRVGRGGGREMCDGDGQAPIVILHPRVASSMTRKADQKTCMTDQSETDSIVQLACPLLYETPPLGALKEVTKPLPPPAKIKLTNLSC